MPKTQTVKMRTTYAGAAGTHQPGAVITVPAAEAEQLIKGGYAVAHECVAPVETADDTARAAGETAEGRPARRRGGFLGLGDK